MSFRECSICHIEREEDTLDALNICPFCADTPLPEPPPAPEAQEDPPDTPKARIRLAKPTSEALLPSQATEDEVPYSPPSFDKAKAEADPQREMAQRVLCRRRLLPFIQRFRPKYLTGWVHEDICRRLERFVKDVEDQKEPRLLLCMPVRHGKSEIASRHFPPWVFGKHPEWEIIAASGASNLAMSFSRYQRDLLRDPAYHTVFPDTKLDPRSQAVENWNTTSGGGYLAAGVGTMITGRGAHILLIDDPVKDAEAADSATIRDNNWEWYLSTALSRLAPGGGVLMIMTWWNEDDLAGRIQKMNDVEGADHFEVVKYPAINDQGDEYILADDTIVQLHPSAPVPPGATLTRKQGTALHPERYPLLSLLKRKATYYARGQQRWWAALYQQNPTPEDGLFFTKDMLVGFTHAPTRDGRMILQAWDFAITDKQKADWTVGITGLLDEYDNIYILDVWRFKTDDGIELGTAIVTYAMTWGADKIGVEDGQIWKSIKANFERACEAKHHYPSYDVLVPLTDKRARAQPARGRMQQKKVLFRILSVWWETFKNELLRFEAGGKHDDQVDALAHLVSLALAQARPKGAPKPKEPKSWKTKLKALIGSQGESGHMSA